MEGKTGELGGLRNSPGSFCLPPALACVTEATASHQSESGPQCQKQQRIPLTSAIVCGSWTPRTTTRLYARLPNPCPVPVASPPTTYVVSAANKIHAAKT